MECLHTSHLLGDWQTCGMLDDCRRIGDGCTMFFIWWDICPGIEEFSPHHVIGDWVSGMLGEKLSRWMLVDCRSDGGAPCSSAAEIAFLCFPFFVVMISSTVLFIYFKTSINWLQWSQNSITFSSEQIRGSCMFRVVRNDAFVRRISIIRITRIEVHWIIFLVVWLILLPLICLTPLPVLFLPLLISNRYLR